MRILVIGGMHGNEPLGIAVVKALQSSTVDTLVANRRAIDQNVRFIKTDLNRTFPGCSGSDDYETNRAAFIVKRCQDYDLVIDFHNTHCPNNDCSFVGRAAAQSLYDASSYFGFKRLIVADYECLNKYAPNCISVEVSLDSAKMNIAWWVKKITALSKRASIPQAKNLDLYQFAYRMTLEDRDRLSLDKMNLKAFTVLDKIVADKLGVESPAYPIFIGDRYTPYNFGGLLNKLDQV